MLVSEWLDENVVSLWLAVFKLQAELQAITKYVKEKNPERFRSKDNEKCITVVKNDLIPVYDFQNKHTVYYRQGRSYYRVRPPRTVPRLDDWDNDCNPL